MDDNQSLIMWLEKHREVNLTISYEEDLLYGGHIYHLEMVNNKGRVGRVVRYIDPIESTMTRFPLIDTILDDMYRELTKE